MCKECDFYLHMIYVHMAVDQLYLCVSKLYNIRAVLSASTTLQTQSIDPHLLNYPLSRFHPMIYQIHISRSCLSQNRNAVSIFLNNPKENVLDGRTFGHLPFSQIILIIYKSLVCRHSD